MKTVITALYDLAVVRSMTYMRCKNVTVKARLRRMKQLCIVFDMHPLRIIIGVDGYSSLSEFLQDQSPPAPLIPLESTLDFLAQAVWIKRLRSRTQKLKRLVTNPMTWRMPTLVYE